MAKKAATLNIKVTKLQVLNGVRDQESKITPFYTTWSSINPFYSYSLGLSVRFQVATYE